MKNARKRQTLKKEKGVKLKLKPKPAHRSKSSLFNIKQKRHSAIVESSHDAILSKNLDGIILTWNKAAERIYGYTKEEIVGKSVSVIVPDGLPNELPEILRKIKSGETIERYETVRRRKDGKLIDISLSVSPVKDEKGRIIGASAVAHEITDEKHLRDIRNFLASIVDSSEDAIISKDLDGFILSWNKGAEKIYGYRPEEVIGKHVSILTTRDREDEIKRIIGILKRGERIEHYETIRVTKSGHEINVSLTVSPILDSEDRIIAASVIARDITGKKKAEEERSRLLGELARSLQEKNVLLQEVYHRVKNNLQVIGSMLDLRSRYLDKDPEKAMAAFVDSVTRIRAMALIHESLYQTESLDTVDFLTYMRTLSNQLLNSYGGEKSVSINITGTTQFYSLDIAVPLGLIFNELITNSLKYAFRDLNEGAIEIIFRAEKQNTIIQISDNGIGLPPDFDFVNSETFGFRIVKLLTKQLNVEITQLRQPKGTSFELKILKSLGSEEPNAFY